MSENTMEYDVVIVGAGPSGLSAAIKLKQQRPSTRVCIIEKGSQVGAHILSGAVLEPRALNELIPDWQQRSAPLNTAVTDDTFLFLGKRKAMHLPTPAQMRNTGNYIISLGQFCQWLADQATELGVEIYPGFAASDILYNDLNQVCGIKTGDKGVTEDGSHGPNYQPGIEIHARYTLLAEGCRGSLTESLIHKFDLRDNASPQTYGLGIKEIWQVQPEQHKPGTVIHTVGWPMDRKTYGGGFIYHLDNHRVAIGFVVGLDYKNMYLDPFQEMQRYKTHPAIRDTFNGGKRLSYGARSLNEGGLQSLPDLTFPGGALIGCSAGFLNVPKIKGTHTAMKSGMLAADCIVRALDAESTQPTLSDFPKTFKQSWAYQELYRARNIRPGFRLFGLYGGLAYAAFDTYILRGRAPWTFKNYMDHLDLYKYRRSAKRDYPAPDNQLTFDKASSVFLSNTHHQENQPCHLKVKDARIPIELNLQEYEGVDTRYCPADVFEYVYENKGDDKSQPRLQINASNCLHCKACDIKDPAQNLVWTTPEGGDGPNYQDM